MNCRTDLMYAGFLAIAARLNRELGVAPLLFGSLGLTRRLGTDLAPDDIDILLPERFVTGDWHRLEALMTAAGYVLRDEEEHEFENKGLKAAFASLESLGPFAGVDTGKIPTIRDHGADYLLLELSDYLKVYQASSQDGYRHNVKHKQDQQKIRLIMQAMGRDIRSVPGAQGVLPRE